MGKREEVLTVDRLCSGDRPSVFVAGMMLAQVLRKNQTAVVMVDALGQIVLMPPESISVLARPRVQEEDLDQLSEDDAIGVMAREGRSDEEVLNYFRHRRTQGS